MKSRIEELTLAERLSLGHFRRTKRRRQDWRFSIETLRMREIEALIRHRFRGPLPNPEGTDDRETCLDFVRAAAFSLSGQDMESWCRVWAPWAAEAEVLPIIAEASKRRRMMRADGVAGLLHVTMAERMALKLKTIGAADMTKAERENLMKARKRERDRQRQEEKRRAAGRAERKSHVARTLKAMKPWEAEGVSRATWFRRQRETRKSRVDINRKSDTRVSQSQSHVSLHVQGHVAARAARGDWGSGTESPAGHQGAAPHGRRFIRMSPPDHLRKDAA